LVITNTTSNRKKICSHPFAVIRISPAAAWRTRDTPGDPRK
jgi:hypothetical protein